MEVNDNLQSMLACPLDALLQVRQLTRNVRLPSADLKGPVSDGYPDVVQTCVMLTA